VLDGYFLKRESSPHRRQTRNFFLKIMRPDPYVCTPQARLRFHTVESKPFQVSSLGVMIFGLLFGGGKAFSKTTTKTVTKVVVEKVPNSTAAATSTPPSSSPEPNVTTGATTSSSTSTSTIATTVPSTVTVVTPPPATVLVYVPVAASNVASEATQAPVTSVEVTPVVTVPKVVTTQPATTVAIAPVTTTTAKNHPNLSSSTSLECSGFNPLVASAKANFSGDVSLTITGPNGYSKSSSGRDRVSMTVDVPAGVYTASSSAPDGAEISGNC
jgi:hypothetical protein